MSDVTANDSMATLCDELVAAAVLAPTPDNNQPWLFERDGNVLRLYIDPQRALPSDVQGMFDLMGIGAALENMCIAARERGIEPQIQLPSGVKAGDFPNLVATLAFEQDGQSDPLYSRLSSRCTNRKFYAKATPDEASMNRISLSAQRFGTVRIDWICDRTRINGMAQLIAATDLIRFQYEPFHAELFRQLRFRVEEAEQTGDGLDVRTLELPSGVSLALQALRSWRVMKGLHRLGLGRLLTVPSSLAVRNSGALAVISCAAASRGDFLEGGRALQRSWLQADEEGLALQPLGSPSIFFAHQELLGGAKLSKVHSETIRYWISRFHELVPDVLDRRLLMVVRIGKAPPPSYRSARRPLDEVLQRP